MLSEYEKKLSQFFEALGKSATMVLATSLNQTVSARTVSVIVQNGKLYFQTDETMRKYKQLMGNANAALCTDNMQIEGVCRDIGHPSEHPDFCTLYREAFPGSFAAYTNLKHERLLELTPVFIQKWVYENGNPYMEQLDCTAQTYEKTAYKGE